VCARSGPPRIPCGIPTVYGRLLAVGTSGLPSASKVVKRVDNAGWRLDRMSWVPRHASLLRAEGIFLFRRVPTANLNGESRWIPQHVAAGSATAGGVASTARSSPSRRSARNASIAGMRRRRTLRAGAACAGASPGWGWGREPRTRRFCGDADRCPQGDTDKVNDLLAAVSAPIAVGPLAG
jgi:hypothetical protein